MFFESGRERTGVSFFSFTFAAVMIVANMNLHQVYADLTGELKKLDWKRDTLLKKAVAALRKSEVYPACVTYEYQMQASKNQYVIYFYCEYPLANIQGGYLCILFDGKNGMLSRRGWGMCQRS